MKRFLVLSLVLIIVIISGCSSSKGSNGNNAAAGGDNASAANTSNQAAEGASASTSSKEEQVTIKFVWGNMEDSDKQVWNDYLIKPFEEKYPNIKIDFQAIPNVNDTIKVQLSSGGGPDLFMLDAFDVKDYAEAGRILELDKYVQQYGWNDLIFPWAMDVAKYNGKQYSIPHEYESTMLYYNKDLLDKNGWPVPTTREEFEKVCSEAMDKGIIPIEYGNASETLLNQWLYEHYITTYSGIEATKELFQGKKKFTDPEIKGAFDLLNQDWQKGWWNNKNTAAITNDVARSLFYNQKALFNVEGTWMQTEFAKGVAKFNWGATAWPSMKDGVPAAAAIGVGAVVAVNKNTKYADQVAQFIDFMFQSKELRAQGVAHGLQPLAGPFDASLYPKDMNPDSLKVMNAMNEVTKDASKVGYTPWSFYPTKTNQYLYENLDKVFYKKMSLDDYLKKAQETLDADIKAGFKFAVE